jgi:hypothetical protein
MVCALWFRSPFAPDALSQTALLSVDTKAATLDLQTCYSTVRTTPTASPGTHDLLQRRKTGNERARERGMDAKKEGASQRGGVQGYRVESVRYRIRCRGCRVWVMGSRYEG